MPKKSDKTVQEKLRKLVVRSQRTWRGQQDTLKELAELLKRNSSLGPLILQVAINRRRHYRRYLRARFGYDMLHQRVFNPSRLPKTPYEYDCNYIAQREFLMWNTAYLVASFLIY